ncbi:MAG: universal stress protein [Elusimicrobia bacterium]|nr:universal stress protein [Elusimicrobiota bacterium]
MKRFPPSRILVAADLSAPSLAALDAAKALARRWGAALEIVHVRQPPLPASWVVPEGVPMNMPPAEQETEREVEAKLRKAAEGFPAGRLKLRTMRGWPPAALAELARHERADMLVMGTHGYAGFDRFLMGSVSEALVRAARIPVLIVPEKRSVAGVARVLAPWNGRPYATRALRWARDLALGLGAALDVLCVDEPGAARKDAASLRKRLASILGSGPGWTLRRRRGDARACIVAEANSGRCGLVALSAHRRLFASDVVLGSTAERLLRHASVPVLAVPSGRLRPRLIRRLASRAGARLY